MKLLLISIIYLLSGSVFAECTVDQKNAEIDLTVIRVPGSVKAGGNHGLMDNIAIHAPTEVMGLPIVAMEITRGEVADFWLPLAYKIINGRAVTSITGYQSALKNFEVAVYYENANCKKSQQRML